MLGCSHSAPKTAPPLADPRFAQLRFRFYPGVTSVDNMPIARPDFVIPLSPQETKFNVVPGERDVAAAVSYQNGGSASWRFRFIFEAGHSYKAESDLLGSKLKITDEQTGVSVALRPGAQQ